MSLSQELIDHLMTEALSEAEKAFLENEVPVGAVVSYRDKIIARAHNTVEKDKQVSSHAEVLAMQFASKVIGDWRLTECILCVTLEPCSMCIGAIRLSRIGTIIYGASDPRLGACGSLFDLSQDPRLGATPRVISGVREDDCRNLLQEFFIQQRKGEV